MVVQHGFRYVLIVDGAVVYTVGVLLYVGYCEFTRRLFNIVTLRIVIDRVGRQFDIVGCGPFAVANEPLECFVLLDRLESDGRAIWLVVHPFVVTTRGITDC